MSLFNKFEVKLSNVGLWMLIVAPYFVAGLSFTSSAQQIYLFTALGFTVASFTIVKVGQIVDKKNRPEIKRLTRRDPEGNPFIQNKDVYEVIRKLAYYEDREETGVIGGIYENKAKRY